MIDEQNIEGHPWFAAQTQEWSELPLRGSRQLFRRIWSVEDWTEVAA